MYISLDMVEGFSCEMCGKCCRNDWMVTVDEESYQRNEAFFAAQGKKTDFEKFFVPLTGNNSVGEYAYIAKGPAGGCCFLAEENFCHLHRTAGHEHLDHVCQTFPRYPMNTARGLELTLTFNCPAVFEKINRFPLLEIIRSEESPCVVNPDSVAVHVFPNQQAEDDPLHYYFELEQHFIDIIQWRSLPMGKRLEFLSKTIVEMNKLKGKDAIGQSLNRIFHNNYAELDKNSSESILVMESDEVTPEILLEHFFVNIIFQKNFYTYGLVKGMELLAGFWQRSQKEQGNPMANFQVMKDLIMDMAFQHNHHRLR